jgi:hypothetical protein
MSNFSNDAGTGSVNADLATITAITGNLTGNVTGNLTGNVTGSISGGTTTSLVPQLVAAAGATQGAATAITGSLAIITVCTASARGAKLPTAATGKMVYVLSACTQGTKIWPFAGDKISTSATNVAVVQAGFKGKLYVAKDATSWYTLLGA